MPTYNGTPGNDSYWGGSDADQIHGNGGNDYLLGNGGDDQIFGGDGDDNLHGGEGNDLLEGGAGNDSLQGNEGMDILRGQGGDDRLLVLSLPAGDLFDGGDGVDTLQFDAGGSTPLTFSIADPSVAQNLYGATVVNIERLSFRSGSGNDDITGGALDDYIDGFGGDDRIDGGLGNDNLDGEFGTDTIYGGGGNDTIRGGSDGNPDTLYGGEGDDTFYWNSGDALIDGGSGVDQIRIEYYSSTGVTADLSNPNVETMVLGTRVIGVERLWLAAGSGNDHLTGGVGDDVLGGGGGDDILIGGTGNDSLSGGDGNDQLSGGAGDDFLHNYTSDVNPADIIDGGEGFDILEFRAMNATGPITIDLLSATGPVTNVEQIFFSGGSGVNNVSGGTESDTFWGGVSGDYFDGRGGDDWMLGNGGDDVIIGGDGNDYIEGGSGSDSLSGGAGNDILRDNEGNDSLDGGEGADELIGGLGDDTLVGGSGNDTLIGADGSDSLDGGDGDDLLEGGSGDDTLNGEGGDDQLYGNAGSDTLNGGAGHDYIGGGIGGDTVIGGDGNDQLYSNEAPDPEQGYFSFHPGFPEFYQPPVLDRGSEIDNVNGGAGQDFVSIGYGDSADGGTEDNFSGGDELFLSLILSPTGLTIDFRDSTLTIGGGTITGFENVNFVEGTQFNDVFTFSAQPFPIEGFGGPAGGGKEISSLGGDDRVIAGYYTNNIWGGDGNDFLDGSASQYLLSIDGGDGNDTILSSKLSGVGAQLSGGAGDDLIMGGTGIDTILGGDGDDYLDGVGGDDSLFGGGGNDTLYAGLGNNLLDGGEGVDTARYTYGSAVTVDLAQEGPQDVGGGKLHTLVGIENLGGSAFGADNLKGNADANILTGMGGNDTLTGGGGNDTFRDSIEQLNGDTITDFSPGDRIVFTDASLANFTYSLSGNTLTFTGGALTLTGFTGPLYASVATGGGVQLTVVNDAINDFNGDGRSDVLWHHSSGRVMDWLGQANGGFVGNLGNFDGQVGTDWNVANTGDFNGDGRDDVLWRSDSGAVTNWLGQTNGGFASNFANAYGEMNVSWSIAGTGDFNGDGRDDVLWHHSSGRVTDWLAQANGGFASNIANFDGQVGTNWHIVGTGDFNGDGRDDVLWRSDSGEVTNWLGQANGGFASNFANAYGVFDTSWHVAGVGDFNGDGRDDVLWHHSSGRVTNWLGQANGGFAGNFAYADAQAGTDWDIAGVGDYNGDGRDDVLWRSDSGAVTNWLGQANGGFASNFGNAYGEVDNSWHIRPASEGLI